MQIVFSYLLLLFLRTCFSSGSSSQAGPSNPNPQAGSPQQVNGLQELLRSCFDLNLLTVVGPPKDAKFTLEAIDDFRLVRLTFRVDGLEDGSKCTLIWDDASSDWGSIQSVYGPQSPNSGSPVEKEQTSVNHFGMTFGQTGVRIDIYNRDYPHWELISFFPSNLLSGKFLRSFIVQGMAEQTMLFGHRSPVNLRVVDSSMIRELYWLENGGGKTYFESVWNLEYDCIVGRFGSQKDRFYKHTKECDQNLALLALSDLSWAPIRRAFPGLHPPVQEFTPAFMYAIHEWMKNKDESQMSLITIRQALDEFIPLWKDKYNRLGQQIMAQNTFMYFFKHDPGFDMLARQVLLHYDATCNTMSGYPIDKDPRKFSFSYIDGPDTPSHAMPRSYGVWRQGASGERELVEESYSSPLPPPSLQAAISRHGTLYPPRAAGSVSLDVSPGELPGVQSQDSSNSGSRSLSGILASQFGDLSVVSPELMPRTQSAPNMPPLSLTGSPPAANLPPQFSHLQPGPHSLGASPSAPLPPQFAHLQQSDASSSSSSPPYGSPPAFGRMPMHPPVQPSTPATSIRVNLGGDMSQEEAADLLSQLEETQESNQPDY